LAKNASVPQLNIEYGNWLLSILYLTIAINIQ